MRAETPGFEKPVKSFKKVSPQKKSENPCQGAHRFLNLYCSNYNKKKLHEMSVEKLSKKGAACSGPVVALSIIGIRFERSCISVTFSDFHLVSHHHSRAGPGLQNLRFGVFFFHGIHKSSG